MVVVVHCYVAALKHIHFEQGLFTDIKCGETFFLNWLTCFVLFILFLQGK